MSPVRTADAVAGQLCLASPAAELLPRSFAPRTPAGAGTKWFRACIQGRAKTEAGAPATGPGGLELHEVSFIDYGNRDTVTAQRLRPLDASLAAVAPLARECTLALVRVPKLGGDHGTDAAAFVSDAVFGRHVAMKSHGRDVATGTTTVSLWDPETGACLNEELVGAGLARIARTEAKRITRRAGGGGGGAWGKGSGAASGASDKDAELLARLEAAQAAAKGKRLGLFQYGDAGDSDDERR